MLEWASLILVEPRRVGGVDAQLDQLRNTYHFPISFKNVLIEAPIESFVCLMATFKPREGCESRSHRSGKYLPDIFTNREHTQRGRVFSFSS